MRRAILAGALAALAATAPAASAARTPVIQAHRGGAYVDGKAKYAENTLPAFRVSARAGYVLELDIGVTSDGIPVVLHDQTLDRTTTCAGALNSVTLAQLKACPSDIVGGGALTAKKSSKRTAIPTLTEVLSLAKSTGATVSAELKDYDGDNHRINQALDVLSTHRLPKGHLIIQSFFPSNLAVARTRLPGIPTAHLTLKAQNTQGLTDAQKAHDTYVSPQWPVTRSYVQRAHRSGLKVVPYTVDTKTAVRSAAARGVDAIITDDPSSAKRWLKKKR